MRITVWEAARITGLGRGELYRAIGRGELYRAIGRGELPARAAVPAGSGQSARPVLIDRDDLLAWLTGLPRERIRGERA